MQMITPVTFTKISRHLRFWLPPKSKCGAEAFYFFPFRIGWTLSDCNICNEGPTFLSLFHPFRQNYGTRPQTATASILPPSLRHADIKRKKAANRILWMIWIPKTYHSIEWPVIRRLRPLMPLKSISFGNDPIHSVTYRSGVTCPKAFTALDLNNLWFAYFERSIILCALITCFMACRS